MRSKSLRATITANKMHPISLHVTELIVCTEPNVIATTLDSGVAVCIFSDAAKIGGMVHFSHPRAPDAYDEAEAFQYGDIAIPSLIEEVAKLSGLAPHSLKAKIAGGATLETLHESVDLQRGKKNIEVARLCLKNNGVEIIGESVGGALEKRLLFHTSTGRLQTKFVNSTTQVVRLQVTPPEVQSRRLRVLIVDDSKTIQKLLKKIISEDPDLEVLAIAGDPLEAEELIKAHRPDVITLDIQMPKMTGVEWLEKYLAIHKIPVVMISSLQLQDGNEVFKALELGAVDYIQKPTLGDLPQTAALIREKVKAAATAKVRVHSPSNTRKATATAIDQTRIVAIGASTGGTEAIKSVLCALPETIPPIVIVQHIPPVFSKAFADRLNGLCPFEVKEAEDDDQVLPNRVLLAPGGRQMKIKKNGTDYSVRITDDPPVSRHKPSVDYLFQSVAHEVGKFSIGVILTGMGADGARGLLLMRKSGARTLGQNEESSVVYGMPRAAFELGAVEKSLALEEIAQELISILTVKKVA